MKILKSILLILIFLSGIKVESQDSKGKAKLAAEIVGSIVGASLLIGLSYKGYIDYLKKKGLQDQEIKVKALPEKQYSDLEKQFTNAVKNGDKVKIYEIMSRISIQFPKDAAKFMFEMEPIIRDILYPNNTEKVIDFKIDLARKYIGIPDAISKLNEAIRAINYPNVLGPDELINIIKETSQLTGLTLEYITDRLSQTEYFQKYFHTDPYTNNLLVQVKQFFRIKDSPSFYELNIRNTDLRYIQGAQIDNKSVFKIRGLLYDKNTGQPITNLEEIHKIETSGISIPRFRLDPLAFDPILHDPEKMKGNQLISLMPEMVEPGPGQLVTQVKPGMSMSEFESPIPGGPSHIISFEPHPVITPSYVHEL